MGRRKKRVNSSDEEDLPSKSSHKYGHQGGYKYREILDVALMIDQDEVDAYRLKQPCWKTVHSGPSTIPSRHLCVICGFFADYKCIKCATRRNEQFNNYYCSFRCKELHHETNCGKSIHYTQW